MNPERPKTPESELPEYENLSESHREFLLGQFGIEDAEMLQALISGELLIEDPEWPTEEITKHLKEALSQEQ